MKQRVPQDFQEFIKGFLQRVLAKCDPETWQHSLRVSKYCETISQNLDLPASEVAYVTIAGLLHDMGKVFMAEMINYPGKLAEKERNLVFFHPQLGIRFITIHWEELPRSVKEGILLHHERLDGTGYPFNLRKNEVPLSARIVAVSDVFDAMSTNRPYRHALPKMEIIKELGSPKYDEKVVVALFKYLRKNHIY